MKWPRFLSLASLLIFLVQPVLGQIIQGENSQDLSRLYSILTSSSASPVPGCSEPKNVFMTHIASDAIRLEWADVIAKPDGVRYQIRLRTKSEREALSDWKHMWVFNGNMQAIHDLEPETMYEFEIRKLCGGSWEDYEISSDWIPIGKWERGGQELEFICDWFQGAEVIINPDGSFTILLPPSLTDTLISLGLNYLISYQDCESGNWYYDVVFPTSAHVIGDSRIGAGGGGIDGGDTSDLVICNMQITITDYNPFTYKGSPYFGMLVAPGSDTTSVLCSWLTLIEEDPNFTQPTSCGEPFTPPNPSSTPFQGTLQEGDSVSIAGFIVYIVEDNPLTGLFTLPFQNKKVLVDLSQASLNEDLELYSGEVQLIASDSLSPPESSLVTPGEQCRPVEEIGYWDENGKHSETDTIWDPNGFSADGFYIKQPPYPGYEEGDSIDPSYDPCGFDVNGIHWSTQTAYNEDGCSRDSSTIDHQPCSLNCIPYYWLQETETQTEEGVEFYNQIKDTLSTTLGPLYVELIEEQDSIVNAKDNECNGISSAMRSIVSTNELDSTYIFGESSEYINPGLSKNFTSAPQPMHQQGITRNADIKELEKKHIDLYECDIVLEGLKDVLDMFTGFRQAIGVDELMEYLEQSIKSFNESDVANYQSNPNLWKIKLKELIREYVELTTGVQNSLGFLLNNNQSIKLGLNGLGREQHNVPGDPGLSPDYIKLVSLQLLEERLPDLYGGTEEEAELLPLILSREIGGKTYSIVITRIALTPTYGELDAFMKVTLPISGEEIVFKAFDLQFTPAGLSSGILALGSEVRAIKLNNVASLVLNPDSTYVKWGCNGFEVFSIDGFVEFCEEYLLPLDPQTLEPIQEPADTQLVKAHFQTVITKFDGIYATLDMDKFAIKGAEHIRWQVQGAVMDMSEKISPSFQFPAGYATSFGINNAPSPFWKGFYLDSLVATMTEFKDNSGNPLVFGVNDLMIDDRGISGEVYLDYEVLPLSEGNLGGWAFSIEGLQVHIIANQVFGGGFSGLVHIPLIKNNTESDTIYQEDCLDYIAEIRKGGNYDFSVSPVSTMKIPAWQSEVVLDSTSFLNISKLDSSFLILANLSGELSFNQGIFDSQIDALRFQNLELSNQPKYFNPGIWELPDTIQIGFKNFGLSVYEIGLENDQLSNDISKLNMAINIEVNKDFKVSATGGLNLEFKLHLINNRQIWKFQKVNLEYLGIEADIKGTYIKGDLLFFDEADSTTTHGFGKGFQANLSVNFKKINEKKPNENGQASGFIASGIFGEVSGYNYFNVDVLVKFSPSIPLVGPVNVNGIGGGLSYHMDRVNQFVALPPPDSISGAVPLGLGQSMSGVQYVPNDTIGIGIKLLLAGSIGKESICSINAGFEISFNSPNSGSNSAINKICIWGQGELMSELNFTKLPIYPEEILGNPLLNSIIPKEKLDQLISPDANAKISAYLNLEFNVNVASISGNFALFLQAGDSNNPILYGRALAELYIGGDDWYFNVGRLKEDEEGRVELTLDIAIVKVMAKAYLNIGTDIPPLPPPPQQIQDLFGQVSSPDASLGYGTGFAFGIAVDVGINLDFWIGKISINAGFGFDLAIKQYKDVVCANTNGELGINGWYASGQAYLYLKGRVEVLNFKLLDITTGVLLQAGFPNPSWVKGEFKLKYKVLLVKGTLRAKLSFGDKCDVTGLGQDLPEVIFNVSPYYGSKEVNTFGTILVDFNIPMDTVFHVSSGGSTAKYETKITELVLETSFGLSVPFTKEWSTDKQSLEIIPEYTLPSNDSLTFMIVTELYKNDQLYTNAEELERTVGFWTSEEIKSIPKANISAEYPVNGMANFYRQEYVLEKGYVILEKNMYDLYSAPEGKCFGALLIGSETTYFSPVIYINLDKKIEYDLPSDVLSPGEVYRVELAFINKDDLANANSFHQVAGFQGLEYNSVYHVDFRVSLFSTITSKLEAIESSQATSIVTGQNLYEACIQMPINIGESFDELEVTQDYTPINSIPSISFRENILDIAVEVNPHSNSPDQAELIAWYDSVLIKYVLPFEQNASAVSKGYNFTDSGDPFDVIRQSIGITSECNTSNQNVIQGLLDGDAIAAYLGYHNLTQDPGGFGDDPPLLNLNSNSHTIIDSSLIGDQYIRIYTISMARPLIQLSRKLANLFRKDILQACLDDIQGSPITGGNNQDGDRNSRQSPGYCQQYVENVLGERLMEMTLENGLTGYPVPPESVTIPVRFTYSLPGLGLGPTTDKVIEINISEN